MARHEGLTGGLSVRLVPDGGADARSGRAGSYLGAGTSTGARLELGGLPQGALLLTGRAVLELQGFMLTGLGLAAPVPRPHGPAAGLAAALAARMLHGDSTGSLALTDVSFELGRCPTTAWKSSMALSFKEPHLHLAGSLQHSQETHNGGARDARSCLPVAGVYPSGAATVILSDCRLCCLREETEVGSASAEDEAPLGAGAAVAGAEMPAGVELAMKEDAEEESPVRVAVNARRLLAAMEGEMEDMSRRPMRLASWGAASSHGLPAVGLWQSVFAAMLLVAVVCGAWLRRLLSCACLAPPANPPAPHDPSRSHNQNRSIHRTSQGHPALQGLQRFSSALRKGDDPEGSRHGRLDGSVRGGNRHAHGSALALAQAPPVAVMPLLPPPMLAELSELKRASQGRLATTLEGVFSGQHRVVVKVVPHEEECLFMMEQVGEVWSRLAHPNVVTCYAADTFPTAALANAPQVADLLPMLSFASTAFTASSRKPEALATITAKEASNHAAKDASAHHPPARQQCQTWMVLEKCDNGSLAAILAQRFSQQKAAARRIAAEKAQHDAAALAAAEQVEAAKGEGKHGGAAGGLALVAKQLGRFSRGRRKSAAATSSPESSAGTPVAHGNGSAHAAAAFAPIPAGVDAEVALRTASATQSQSAPPAPLTAIAEAAAPALLSVGAAAPEAEQESSSAPLAAPRVQSQADVAAAAAAGGEGDDSGPLPGLLPVTEILSIAHDVASGLAYLHSLDLCHGDLRAENVLVQTLVLPSGARGGPQGCRRPGDGSNTSVILGSGGEGELAAAAAAGSSGRDGDAAGARTAMAVAMAAAAAANGSVGGISGTGSPEDAALTRTVTYDSGGEPPRGPNRPGYSLSSSAATGTGTAMGDSTGTHTLTGGWSNGMRPSTTCFSSTAVSVSGVAGAAARSDGTPMASDVVVMDEQGPVYGSGQSNNGLNQTLGFTTANVTGGALGRGGGSFAGGRSQLGAAAAAALAGRVPALPEDGIAAFDPVSAMALTSAQPRAGSTGPATFARRPSGSFQANLSANNSTNDMAAASKALCGLSAWPESPPRDGMLGSFVGRCSSGNASLARTGSGAVPPAAPPGPPPPPRRPMPMGGLRSALASPENAGGLRSTLAPPSPSGHSAKSSASLGGPAPPSNQQPPKSPFATAAAPPQTRHAQSAVMDDPYCPRTPRHLADGVNYSAPALAAPAAAVLATARLPSGDHGPATPDDVTLRVRSAAHSALPSPHVGPPADAPGSGASSAAPSTPTTCLSPVVPAAASPALPAVVCTIAGAQQRRASAVVPGGACLPVIRRVAKLSDPWLSLARLPPDLSGGPWSPEAAAAIGAVTGADVAHLPPELLLSGRLHPSSDVYSLALLIWRMLSPIGEAPHAKLSPAETAYKVAACGMRPSFSPAVPEPLKRLVEDCWASDPAQRPTVQQILQRLAELQASAPSLQRQWRERHALFGAVATVPITAVATPPLRGDLNELATRWADSAGIRLPRTSLSSFGGRNNGGDTASGGISGLVRHSSMGLSGSHSTLGVAAGPGAVAPSFQSGTNSINASAAHLYAQPPLTQGGNFGGQTVGSSQYLSGFHARHGDSSTHYGGGGHRHGEGSGHHHYSSGPNYHTSQTSQPFIDVSQHSVFSVHFTQRSASNHQPVQHVNGGGNAPFY
ncbi:hypothetical protein HYH03_005621 [Edaphochlamys debaryana]|uniref:Serine-threonine/tyrosine-protein kinase catalytic domain-containing protein n=1 Tax=Edaphochlamys debaryana TaxID=47281 RepID=A0A835Y762_9CHLO|nr:hypothetical protein HYH03_005621 [Edaphochlamys debaryana]|eukprot:KAG2496394.1 hypothetical protein HYH03_005621 [Edaphochlamys debaryana]